MNVNKKFVIANWKNHPDSLAEAEQILDSVDEYLGSSNLWINDIASRSSRLSTGDRRGPSLVFCPPFVFLEEVGKILKTSHLSHQSELGAQDISTDDETALTGEVSGLMLNKLDVRYVIVGHSERRWKLGESDEVVNKKLKAALRNNLVPIVCLGEKVRDENFKDFLREQTVKTFEGLNADEVRKCLIAYEPVWAISTTSGAHPDTPQSALESINIIKDTLTLHFSLSTFNFLYGGSVTSKNIKSFLDLPQFDGVLVGGASVNKDEFVKILTITAKP